MRRSNVEGAPLEFAGVEPDGWLETVDDWHQVAERIVLGAPFVAVEGVIVPSDDLTAKLLPAGNGESDA